MSFKMHKAPLDERLDFYRYKSALQVLNGALEALRLVQTKTDSMERMALWTAFYTLYAKSFKQQRDKKTGLGLRLATDIIPNEFLDQHNAIIQLRDKMYAHTDLDLFDDGKNSLNQLGAFFAPDGKVQFSLPYVLPANDTFDKYGQLIETLIKTVQWRADKIWKKWEKHLSMHPGHWRLNIAPDNDDVFIGRRN